MPTLEFPAIPWKSPRSAAYRVEAIRPADFQSTDSFTESACTVSSSSPLEYSLREACLPELNARLRVEGFEPPGKGLAAWVRLARIVQVDAASFTVDELVEEACAWAERVRVTERIRLRMGGSTPKVVEPHRGQQKEWTPRQNKAFRFDGNRVWENWGLGIDVDCRWHLFHFQRGHGRWQRHNHAALKIPRGLPDSLARGLVSGRGILSEAETLAIWKRHSQGYSSMDTIVDRIKTPLSRLRKAIAEGIGSEGHQPEGNSIAWCEDERGWRSRIRFGHAYPGEKRGYSFQPVE